MAVETLLETLNVIVLMATTWKTLDILAQVGDAIFKIFYELRLNT